MAAPSFYLPSSPNFPFNGLVTLQSFTHTYARNHQKKTTKNSTQKITFFDYFLTDICRNFEEINVKVKYLWTFFLIFLNPPYPNPPPYVTTPLQLIINIVNF